MKKKEKDDVMGEDVSSLPEAKSMALPVRVFAGLTICLVQCENPECDSQLAWFYQLQTRSADEPPTSFYKCTKCSKQWRTY
jgi:DNA-directed RNA polymerase subunit M/transcription elongation factor TFIIS